MVACIKQYLSNVWSSIHEEVKQPLRQVKCWKKELSKKRAFQCFNIQVKRSIELRKRDKTQPNPFVSKYVTDDIEATSKAFIINNDRETT